MPLATTLNKLLPRPLRPVEFATARFLRWSQLVVQTGPFRGMRYIDRAFSSALAPKIAGTYEQELHAILPQLFAGRPDLFVDIGTAEGYYAVGAARADWCDRIVAYEGESAARDACREMMVVNGVDPTRIDLRGLCTSDELESLLCSAQRPAILIDVDGFESLLLDPLRVPSLAHARILLEHHDYLFGGLRDELTRRLTPTHEIVPIEQAPRRAEDLVCSDPLVRLLPAGVRRRVLAEHRPFSRHGWLWMTPRTT